MKKLKWQKAHFVFISLIFIISIALDCEEKVLNYLDKFYKVDNLKPLENY